MNKIVRYIKASYLEFKYHVTWPGKKELQSETTVVVVSIAILSLFLAGIDFFIKYGIIQLFKNL